MELTAKVRITKKSRAVGGLLAFIVGFATAGFLGSIHTSGTLAAAAIAAFVCVTGLVTLLRASKERNAVVRADEGGLSLDGDIVVPRTMMDQAYMTPSGKRGAPSATISGPGNVVEVSTADDATATALVRAIRMGTADHAVSFTGVAATMTWSTAALFAFFAVAAGFLCVGLAGAAPLLVGVAAVLGVMSPILFVGNKISIGSDGVLVENRLDRHFWPCGDIGGVARTSRGLELRLRSGRKVSVPITSRFVLNDSENAQREAMLARIEEALISGRSATADPRATVAWRVSRRDRPVADWLRALGSEDEGDFRHAPVRLDDLRELVASHASAHARIGAAFALAKRGSEEERAHIRVAAQALAAPKLRVALETIADEPDDPSVVQAIQEAEAEAEATGDANARIE
jgi:hypothetical protein